jgi:hypothetical protein
MRIGNMSKAKHKRWRLSTAAVNIPTRAEVMKTTCPANILRQTLFRHMLFSAEEALKILE